MLQAELQALAPPLTKEQHSTRPGVPNANYLRRFFKVLAVFVFILIFIYFDRNLFEVTGGGKRSSLFKLSKNQEGKAVLQVAPGQLCADGSPHLPQPPLPSLLRSHLTPLCPRTPWAQLFLTQLASPIISSIPGRLYFCWTARSKTSDFKAGNDSFYICHSEGLESIRPWASISGEV